MNFKTLGVEAKNAVEAAARQPGVTVHCDGFDRSVRYTRMGFTIGTGSGSPIKTVRRQVHAVGYLRASCAYPYTIVSRWFGSGWYAIRINGEKSAAVMLIAFDQAERPVLSNDFLCLRWCDARQSWSRMRYEAKIMLGW